MPSRRNLLLIGGHLLAATACLPWTLLAASSAHGQIPRGPMLEERLLTGLRVKFASDRRFIARVVDLTERGVLPIKLVDSTFFWARSKAARRGAQSNNPMVYFRPGLIARARALRIEI